MDNRYSQRGVSAEKEDIHNAIKNLDKAVLSFHRKFQQNWQARYGGSLLSCPEWLFTFSRAPLSPLFQKARSELPSDEACALQRALWDQGKDR